MRKTSQTVLILFYTLHAPSQHEWRNALLCMKFPRFAVSHSVSISASIQIVQGKHSQRPESSDLRI